MYEHGSGIKWKKDVVEIFKLTSSPPPILILIIFLLSLTVNPNSYHPGSDTSVETKPCAAADAAVCSTIPTSSFNKTDTFLLLFAPPSVLFLFKSLLCILPYLTTLSGRPSTRVPSFITYPITHWSTLWLWGRIIRCSLSFSMDCLLPLWPTWLLFSIDYTASKLSRLVLSLCTSVACNFCWLSINSSAALFQCLVYTFQP